MKLKLLHIDQVLNSIHEGLKNFQTYMDHHESSNWLARTFRKGSVKELWTSDYKKAYNNLVNIQNFLNDESEKKNYYRVLGTTLLKTPKNNRHLTSPYSFIALSIFHLASIVVATNNDTALNKSYKTSSRELPNKKTFFSAKNNEYTPYFYYRGSSNQIIETKRYENLQQLAPKRDLIKQLAEDGRLATVFKEDNCPLLEKNIFTPNSLLTSYAKPATDDVESLNQLYDVIGKLLIKDASDDAKMKKANRANHIALGLAKVSSDDRFKAAIYEVLGDNKAKSYFTDSEAEKFKALNDKLKGNNTIHKDIPAPDIITYYVELTYYRLAIFLEASENIAKGIKAYDDKFGFNTSKYKNALVDNINAEFQGMPTKIGGSVVKQLLENNNISNSIAVTLSGISIAFPPAGIVGVATFIISNFLSFALDSPGYGVIHPHGHTGKTRTVLLANYIKESLMFVQNHYSYLSGYIDNINKCNNDELDNSYKNRTPDEWIEKVKNMCIFINQYIDSSMNGMKEAITTLPNHDQVNNEGSLYNTIKLFADPELDFKPNKSYIKHWQGEKVPGYEPSKTRLDYDKKIMEHQAAFLMRKA